MTGRSDPQAPRRRGRNWPIAVVAVVFGAAVVAVNSPLLAVDSIEILGAEHTDVQAALDEAGLGAGALLLWIDTGGIERSIRQDPWVADVRVERIWPHSVVVEVVEHQPVVWIEGVLGWMLVARDGTVLERADAPGSGLLVASVALPDRAAGERPIDPAWQEIVDMALVLADDIGSTLVLEMRGPEMWTSAFGHEVRLGHPIDLADKGRTLRAMLAGDVPDGAIIDVTSPLRPAVVPFDSPGVVETAPEEG